MTNATPAEPRSKILVLGTLLTEENGGAAHATVTIVRALARAEWADLTLAAQRWDESSFPSEMRIVELDQESTSGPLWRVYPLVSYWSAVRTIRTRSLGEFDFCYTQSIPMALAYRRLHPRVPIALHPGAVFWDREELEEGRLPMRWRQLHARLARHLEARTFRQHRFHQLSSTALVADLRRQRFGSTSTPIVVAPHPVEAAEFDPDAVERNIRAELRIPPERFVIVVVARLVAWKQVDAVIRAVAAVEPSVSVIVVGEGPERARLEAVAATSGGNATVHFVGRQPPRDYLAAGDLFVLPSIIESFGMAYAEAMTMGLPCVGLRFDPPRVISAASEVITEGETGFCVGNDDELRARIAMLAGDRGRCRRLGATARARALVRFHPDRYVEMLRALVLQEQAKSDSHATGG